jgi:GGDEF domain-containing protein
MNKDAELLAEAYQKILEEAMHCKAAKEGCDCNKCDDCEKNQKLEEAKSAKKPDKDGDGVPDWADKKDGEDDNAPENKKDKLTQAENRERFKKMIASKKKSVHKENAEMAQAYETILEFKQINKKFARRYNKVTAAMLKSQPGSEEYGVLKAEREDLVTILKDHGQTPKDLEVFLAKKESENPLPEVQDHNPQTHNQYQDNSYSDTADLAFGSEVSVPAAMENPSIEASTMAPNKPTTEISVA